MTQTTDTLEMNTSSFATLPANLCAFEPLSYLQILIHIYAPKHIFQEYKCPFQKQVKLSNVSSLRPSSQLIFFFLFFSGISLMSRALEQSLSTCHCTHRLPIPPLFSSCFPSCLHRTPRRGELPCKV